MKSNFPKFIHCSQFQFSELGNDAHTHNEKIKTLKILCNTFRSIDKLSGSQ